MEAADLALDRVLAVDGPQGFGVHDAYHFAHELRKPIASVVAYAEILADGLSGELNAEQEDNVRTILRNAAHLDQLVCSLVELAELHGERTELEQGHVELESLCESVQDELAPRFRATGVKLTARLASLHYHARLDGSRLRSALVRILEFAFTGSSEGGEISLELRQTRSAAQLLVQYRSSRSLEDELSQVSTPFGRGGGGQGLGVELYLAASAIRELSGQLQLRGRPGGEREFVIELPSCGR